MKSIVANPTHRFAPRCLATAALLLLLALVGTDNSNVMVCAAEVEENGAVATNGNTVVDLSVDLEDSPYLNTSPGAMAVLEAAEADPLIRTAYVVDHGKVVASYVRDDVDADVPNQVWSTTKSWTSLLIGLLVQDGLVSLNETLGEIFPNDQMWDNLNATDVEFRKAVTVYDLLTMSSGLVDPAPPNGTEMIDMAAFYAALGDGGMGGGGSLEGSLAYPSIGVKGEFSYLGISNILSYVTVERTGKTPREYLAEKVLPDLGIDNADIKWWKNADGVEYAYHGLELTPPQMAKFGQLYLQKGKSSPSTQLISSEWVAESLTQQIALSMEVIPGYPISATYGYLFWSGSKDNGELMGIPGLGDVWCAIGAGGQDICINAKLGRVSVQQRDFDPEAPGSTGFLAIVPVSLNPEVSFDADDGTGPSLTNGDAAAKAENGSSSGSGMMTNWIYGLQYVLAAAAYWLMA